MYRRVRPSSCPQEAYRLTQNTDKEFKLLYNCYCMQCTKVKETGYSGAMQGSEELRMTPKFWAGVIVRIVVTSTVIGKLGREGLEKNTLSSVLDMLNLRCHLIQDFQEVVGDLSLKVRRKIRAD